MFNNIRAGFSNLVNGMMLPPLGLPDSRVDKPEDELEVEGLPHLTDLLVEEDAAEIQTHVKNGIASIKESFLKNRTAAWANTLSYYSTLGVLSLEGWLESTLHQLSQKIITNFAKATLAAKNEYLLEGTQPFTQCSLEDIREFLVCKCEGYLAEIKESEEGNDNPEDKIREVVEKILVIGLPGKKNDIPLFKIPGSDTIGDYRSIIWSTIIRYAAPLLIGLRAKFKDAAVNAEAAKAEIAQKKGGRELIQLIDAITADPAKLLKQENISSKILKKLISKFGGENEAPNKLLATIATFVRPFLIQFAGDLVKFVPENEHVLTYFLDQSINWMEEEISMVQRSPEAQDVAAVKLYLQDVIKRKLKEMHLDGASLNEKLPAGGAALSKAIEGFFVQFMFEMSDDVVNPLKEAKGLREDPSSEAIIRAMARGILPLVAEALGAKSLAKKKDIAASFVKIDGMMVEPSDDEAEGDDVFFDPVNEPEGLPPLVEDRLIEANLTEALQAYADRDIAQSIGKFVDEGVIGFVEGKGWPQFEQYASIYLENALIRIFSKLAGKQNKANVFGAAMEKILATVAKSIDVETLREAYTIWKDEAVPERKVTQENRILALLNPCVTAIFSETGLVLPSTLPLPPMFSKKIVKILRENVIKKLVFEACFDMLIANHPPHEENEALRLFVGSIVPKVKNVIFSALPGNADTVAHAINMNLAQGEIELRDEVALARHLKGFFEGAQGNLEAPLNRLLQSVLYGAMNNMANAYGDEPVDPLLRILFQLRKRIADQTDISPDFNTQVLKYLKKSAPLKAIEAELSQLRKEGPAEGVAESLAELTAEKEEYLKKHGPGLAARLIEIKLQIKPFLMQVMGDMGFREAKDLPLPRYVQNPVWKMLTENVLPEQMLELYSNFKDNEDFSIAATVDLEGFSKGKDIVQGIKTLSRYAMQMVDNFVVANGAKIADMIQGIERPEDFAHPVGARVVAGDRVIGAKPPLETEFLMPALEQNITALIMILMDTILQRINQAKAQNPDLIFKITIEGMKLLTTYLNGRGNADNTIQQDECHSFLRDLMLLADITDAQQLTFLPALGREAVWEQLDKPQNAKMIIGAIFENLLSPKMVTGLLVTTVDSVNELLTNVLQEMKVKKPAKAVAEAPVEEAPITAEQQAVLTEFIKAVSKRFPGSGLSPLVGFLAARDALGVNAMGKAMRSAFKNMDFVDLILNQVINMGIKLEENELAKGIPITQEEILAAKEASDAKFEAEKTKFVSGFRKLWDNIKAVVVESVKSSWFVWFLYMILLPIEWIMFKWVEYRVFRKHAANVRGALAENADHHKDRFLADLLKVVQEQAAAPA